MKTVIIADDSRIMRDLAQATIQQFGYTVLASVPDGEQAWFWIQKHQPTLALLDYSMPFLSGAEVGLRVRDHGIPTKVLFITANGQNSALSAAHYDGVLIKPFNTALMREVLLKVFGEA